MSRREQCRETNIEQHFPSNNYNNNDDKNNAQKEDSKKYGKMLKI